MPATELLRPAFSKPMTHSSREQITTGLDFIRKRGTCKKACAGRTFFLRALAARRLDSTRHLELPHLRTAQSNLFPALSQRLPSALSQRLLRALAALTDALSQRLLCALAALSHALSQRLFPALSQRGHGTVAVLVSAITAQPDAELVDVVAATCQA